MVASRVCPIAGRDEDCGHDQQALEKARFEPQYKLILRHERIDDSHARQFEIRTVARDDLQTV